VAAMGVVFSWEAWDQAIPCWIEEQLN